jgi:archaellum component FlaC
MTREIKHQLIRSINKIVDDVTLQLGDVKNSLTEIENKTSDITLEFSKIKEHVSDLQTFLSLPHLISKASNIAVDDLTFEIKSVIGATPEHSLCAVRAHLIQHGRLCTGQYMWCGSS